MSKPIIVSGIQPTGNLHIGNYLGAVKNWVELQNSGKYQMYIFIADYHSLTGNMKPEDRRAQITRTAAELLAAGIDPEKTVFWVQSHVLEHTELAWVFNSVTPISELERMTQYKDKSLQQAKNINAGLLTYPALQAADILLYHGEVVPVGQDQIQHVELTRDVARWFNKRYQEYFPETKHLLTQIPKVMSLVEPHKKMSKSLGADHVIELADESGVIEKKLKKAVTATEGGGEAPGVANLLLLLKQFGNETIYKEFVKAEKDGTIRYGDLKKVLGESISTYFADFRTRRMELLDNHNELGEILSEGASKAQKVASQTMEEVRKMIGVR
ncbi:MAG TPA: tryptophan--tRNA ligase [Candidatus Magasanikbacteria bacterium]|nr:tryptophan--tRNA ligase [Candidatus Magasanikbacteria bacterium]